MDFIEANNKNEAIRFARENILQHPNEILDFGNINLATINIINRTLFQMVNYFGVKIEALAIDSEENVCNYFETYAKKYSQKYCSRDNPPTKESVLKEIENSNIAFACETGIFLKKNRWENNAHELKKSLKETFENFKFRHSSIEAILIHEYAHVLDHIGFFYERTSKDVTNALKKETINMLMYHIGKNLKGDSFPKYSTSFFKEGICPIDHDSLPRVKGSEIEHWKRLASTFGRGVLRFKDEDKNKIEIFPEEFWAEAVACYFEDRDRGSNILSAKVYEEIEHTLQTLKIDP